MKRLSIFLLAFVVLFTLGVGGWVVAKWRRPKPEPLKEPTQAAEYRIKDIHINETLQGNLRWKLDADQAEVFDKEGKTVMKRVTVTIFSDRNQIWTVTGDEGTMVNQTKDVGLRGNVVVVSNDGLRMVSDDLNWKSEERRLWTEGPVKITREATTVQGNGLTAYVNEERAEIGGKVRVTILNPGRTNLNFFGGGGT